jgi:RHS repeat-associated protein
VQWTPFTTKYHRYEGGTSRLTNDSLVTGGTFRRRAKFVYDSAGNTRLQPDSTTLVWSNPGNTSEERASYYDADGRVVAIDWRQATYGKLGDQGYHWTFDQYRYDAFGRRVMVYSRRDCYDPDYLAPAHECQRGFVRRTIWDGSSELYEIQMPDQAGALDQDTLAVRDTLHQDTNTYWDRQPFFGRVAYTTGLGIDRPLGLVRINYADSSIGTGGAPNRTPHAFHVWQPFSIFVLWNARGQAEAPYFPAQQKFYLSDPADTARHVLTDFYAAWYPYARQNSPMTARSWMGSLVDDKMDKTGLLYRRNRLYDPATGRFTQEDPIGLAAGTNLYGFAAGDPVTYSDPFGLDGCKTDEPCKSPYAEVLEEFYANLKDAIADGFSKLLSWTKDITVNAFLALATDGGSAASNVVIDEAKLGYMFGRATGSAHNIERAVGNVEALAKIGILESAGGKQILREALEAVAADSRSAAGGFTNQYGSYEIRFSLLKGPGGFAKLRSTWQVLPNGGLRFVTGIVMP